MLRRLAAAALIVGTALASAQDSAGSIGLGHWLADARLFNVELREKTGEIPSELVFAPDGAVSGRIGDALIPVTLPDSKSASRIRYRLVVSGQVHRDLGSELNHLVIIVTHRDGAALEADFHLKRRFGFDTAMLVGHFDVKRAN